MTVDASGPRSVEPSNRRTAGLRSEYSACVWVPLFALRCEEHRHPHLALHPWALLAPDDTRRLWQVSHSARRAGAKAGMTVSQAIGLCPTLTLREPDPVYYDEQFTKLLMALDNVSPVVEPEELGRAYVGVDGLEKLFGSPEQQLEAIAQAVWGGREAVSDGQLPPLTAPDRSVYRLGWGRGKFISWLAATKAKPGNQVVVSEAHRIEFLRAQPISLVQIDPDTHRRLWQLGFKTLGELARLPEAALVTQFGKEGRRLWLLASGTTNDPVIGRIKPQPIVAEIDFPTPVADSSMLSHALDRLIERALRDPRRTGWRVKEVRVRAIVEHGVSWIIRVTLKDPSANRVHIALPIKTHLARTPPTGAVITIIVEFTAFVCGTDELQLFARDATSAARAGRQRALRSAVNEIKIRFKRSALYHIVEVHPWSRIPERRYALIDYDP